MRIAITWMSLLAALACAAAEPPKSWQEANRRSAELIQQQGPSLEAADLARLAFDLYPRQAKNYSSGNHAQLLLNLLHVRREAGGEAAARADLDFRVKVLAKHAGADDPVLLDIWQEGMRWHGREDTYHRNAAEFADRVWGADDVRAVSMHVRWANDWRAAHGYVWAADKLRAARERAAKPGHENALVAKIDLSLARLERERGKPRKAIEEYAALIARLEKARNPETDVILETAYAQLEFLHQESGDKAAAMDMRQRRLQRLGPHAELIPVLRARPVYPRDALRRRLSGWVELLLALGPDGTVTRAEVLASEPPGVFDRAAVESVRQWKFRPLVLDGQAVEHQGRQRIEFKFAD